MLIEKIKNKLFPRKEDIEIKRLRGLKRYESGFTSLLGGFYYSDAISFIAGYEEIFIRQNYKFRTAKKNPIIIDCGSNVGLSIFYFKSIYPDAEIIAVEPDPNIFKVLEKNVQTKKLTNVKLLNKAISATNSVLDFECEGGFSGRLSEKSNRNTIKIESIKLSQLISNREVDFLKIDIEGAEIEVIPESKNYLEGVKNIFIEYHSQIDVKQCLQDILNILSENGFRYHLKDAYSSPFPFIERQLMLGMEFQTEIFAFRDEE